MQLDRTWVGNSCDALRLLFTLLSLSCSCEVDGLPRDALDCCLRRCFLFSSSWCRITALGGSARWHLRTIACFGGKYFDYVPPAHQEQAASYCELAISIQAAVRDETREE